MVKTLVAIEVDLASSFAIRYACQLGHKIEMEIHPIYVKFPSPEVPMPGVGWVRHTWEREVVETGKEEIQEVLASESATCPRLQEPRVIYGDREIELHHIMEREPFDLYIEGAPYPFTPATIYKRLHSRSYQRMSCPLIWLRGIREIDRVVALFNDPANSGALVDTLVRLFGGSQIPLSLAYAGDGGNFDMRLVAEKAVTDLAAQGCQVSLGEVYPVEAGGPSPDSLKNAGLVAVALERGIRKEDHQLQWLAQIKAPLLLVLL